MNSLEAKMHSYGFSKEAFDEEGAEAVSFSLEENTDVIIVDVRMRGKLQSTLTANHSNQLIIAMCNEERNA